MRLIDGVRMYGVAAIKLAKGAIVLNVAAALAACSTAPLPEVAKVDGKALAEAARTGKPTFVSLNPCTDAMLVEVADPEQILALSHYSAIESASSIDHGTAAEFATTGGTAEEIIALSPDIVLASTFIAPATQRALKRASIPVETFGSPATFDESRDQLERVALISRQPYWGDQLSRNVITSPNLSQTGLTALLWQPGQLVAGEASLVAEHLRWAGFTNYAAELGLNQADYVSLETVLANPPDVLLVAGDAPGQLHPLLENLPDTLVAEFAPNLMYCGGPVIDRAKARLTEIREQAQRKFQ